MITIQEILGTDSVAASRLTINSNFLLIENEINDLEDTFNINTITGAMDISTATSGQIKAKDVYFNTLSLPAAGTPAIILYGTGASAGNASFSGNVSTNTLNVGATANFNVVSATGPATFGATAAFSGPLVSYNQIINGSTGAFVDTNRKASVGTNVIFPNAAVGGGGVTGSYSSPYVLSGQESVIFADCGFVSGLGADAANKTGFYMQAATGSGGVLSPLPAGFRITIVNTNSATGSIHTGVTGASTYYTGFNTVRGQYSSFVEVPSGKPYKSSVTLQWEPRIGLTDATQKGSWVVVSSSLITNF